MSGGDSAVAAGHHGSHPDPEAELTMSELDPVLAKLSYELIEMLRSLRSDDHQERSFKHVANVFGRDERTVSKVLREIDEAFWLTQHVRIIDRPPGHKNYRLTQAGEVFVDLLEPITEATLAAIRAAAAATKRLPILCTSNCLGYLHDLNDALPANRGFDVIPLPRRTAEIDLTALGQRSGEHICLLSTLMSTEQEPRIGTVAQWNDRIEVIPLEIDVPRMLSVEDLGYRRPVTVKEVIDNGTTFLAPHGGPAFDFLNRCYPDWRKLRPFQYIEVPDLDYGLKCLSSRLVRQSAMIVHGLRAESQKLAWLNKSFHLYDFSAGSHNLLAVTGIFRARSESGPSGQDEPLDVVWKVAQDLWSGPDARAA
ncbi:hypothetical protein [Plantactinospora sp. WMMB782]|uniref:hypothetical protein n=1 Tax=Plantactinospora sp. WMMB782 TaxID=3404121 RepID=UPI003B94B663